jgi:hypothetical protein
MAIAHLVSMDEPILNQDARHLARVGQGYMGGVEVALHVGEKDVRRFAQKEKKGPGLFRDSAVSVRSEFKEQAGFHHFAQQIQVRNELRSSHPGFHDHKKFFTFLQR